jgi:hypothetical protein
MSTRNLTVAVVMAVLLLLGCKSSSNVSVNARSQAATLSDGGSASLDLGQGLVIDRARILVKKIALEGEPNLPDGGMAHPRPDLVLGSRGAANHEGGDDQGEDEDGDRVRVGPFLIDLTGDQMSGGIVHVFDGDVPPGRYHEIKIVVAPEAADAGVSAPIAALNGASVIIDGTFAEAPDGGPADAGPNIVPFSYVASLRASQHEETHMKVTSGSTKNVTLTIDPSHWFTGEDGGRLDPTVAANKPAIDDSIRDSIRASHDEDDEDRDDGDRDHGDGDHHGGGH